MEGRKENKYNLSGICPECGKLIKLELVVVTELVEHTDAKKLEAKTDARAGNRETAENSKPESSTVRSVDATTGASETRSEPIATDSGKGKRAKKPGGR